MNNQEVAYKRKAGLKRETKYVVVWFALAIVIAGFLGTMNWREIQNLKSSVSRDVAGEGTILELQPNSHAMVRYEYQVAGRKFERRDRSQDPNPPFARLEVGDEVVVYYDPQHPEEAILGDPRAILNNKNSNSDWIGIVVFSIAAPTLLVARWAWWSSRRRRRGTAK